MLGRCPYQLIVGPPNSGRAEAIRARSGAVARPRSGAGRARPRATSPRFERELSADAPASRRLAAARSAPFGRWRTRSRRRRRARRLELAPPLGRRPAPGPGAGGLGSSTRPLRRCGVRGSRVRPGPRAADRRAAGRADRPGRARPGRRRNRRRRARGELAAFYAAYMELRERSRPRRLPLGHHDCGRDSALRATRTPGAAARVRLRIRRSHRGAARAARSALPAAGPK